MFARSFVATLVGVMLASPAFATPVRSLRGINARQQRQTQRIRQGIKSGEVTNGEANRLRGDEAGVRAEERVYRKSGNGLSPSERKDLEKDLNKNSREIDRAKHNDRVRTAD
jgi:hypothetical protein